MVITEDDELLFSVLFERDFLPQDAEALLGFKPNNGRHVCVSDTCVPTTIWVHNPLTPSSVHSGHSY